MKKLIIVCLGLLLALSARAQSQCFTYSDNYAVYTSVSMSTDGSTIYASTEVSGTGHMNIQSGNGCGSINYGQIQHTPTAVAVITWNNGNSSTGGPVYGASECPDCQIDITSTASVAASTASSYTFSSEGRVTCNFVGNILDVTNWVTVISGAQWTTFEDTQAPPPTCAYSMDCNPGETPACPQEGYLYTRPNSYTGTCDSPGIESNGGWISTDGGTTKYCFGILSQVPKVPGPCGFTTH